MFRRIFYKLHFYEKIITASLISIVGSLFISPSYSQELPIPDGVYLKESHCALYQNNELDFLDFTVENGGRIIGLPESSCLVASSKQISSTRYGVVADCNEFGELWQYSIFLDVISKTNIRIDGTDLYLCEQAGGKESLTSLSVASLIERWHVLNEACRGGFGTDPKTHKACEDRYDAHLILAKQKYCYGKEDQSMYQYQWHLCGKTSNKFEAN